MQAVKVAILFALIATALARPGSIRVLNSGGYVAYFELKYHLNGQDKKEETSNYTAGVAKSLSIPDGATNIQITAYAYIFFGTTSVVFTKTLDAPEDLCYTISGTTLNLSHTKTDCS